MTVPHPTIPGHDDSSSFNPSHPEQRGWSEIQIHIDPIAHDALSAFLFDLGCTGTATEDSNREILKVFLPSSENLNEIRNRLQAFLERLPDVFREVQSSQISIRVLENTDWSLEWRRFYRAELITPRLLVLPPWQSAPDCIPDHLMRIDPGPAFGTGQHPTTRMCLKAMETVSLPDNWTMLDVGTGSGILAIYGVMLGARKVVGLDIDPDALRWAEHNVALNNLTARIELSSGPIEFLRVHYSLITANMLMGEILAVLPRFPYLLEAGGRLVLSGILREQISQVQQSLLEWNLLTRHKFTEKDWACVIASKEPVDQEMETICDVFS